MGLISVLTDIVWRITISWNAGNAACKIVKFSQVINDLYMGILFSEKIHFQVVVTYASTYVLVALSIDRYDAIRHPMKFSGSCKYENIF